MVKNFKIVNCLISVSDKNKILSLTKQLKKYKINIYSTGNTFKVLNEKIKGIKKIEDLTKFPEILNGRVKTLHPNVFGGILGDSKDDNHLKQMNKYSIKKIQLVIVNLYPFKETISNTKNIKKCIENIDIGGPSMVRAAAKNFSNTVIVTDPNDYSKISTELQQTGTISLETRKMLANKAFELVTDYDYEISKWFNEKIMGNESKQFHIKGKLKQNLRYGENPHQKASYFISQEMPFYKKIQGKELSYNNLNDIKTSLKLLLEFKSPCAVIIKHSTPCGVAEDLSLIKAWDKAFAADPLSAFGGVVALNRVVDKEIAKKLQSIFLEVVIAVNFTTEALKILSSKKNLRLLKVLNLKKSFNQLKNDITLLPNGFLIQDRDKLTLKKNKIKVVTKYKPTEKQLENLLFAFKVVKHVRSNAIVLAKNRATVGIGSGNTSRVDSVKFAIDKARRSGKNNKKSTEGAVLASDAFFPFSDSILLAKKAGIKSIIQPGGSLNDQEVIKKSNDSNISMVFTNKRCFSHS